MHCLLPLPSDLPQSLKRRSLFCDHQKSPISSNQKKCTEALPTALANRNAQMHSTIDLLQPLNRYAIVTMVDKDIKNAAILVRSTLKSQSAAIMAAGSNSASRKTTKCASGKGYNAGCKKLNLSTCSRRRLSIYTLTRAMHHQAESEYMQHAAPHFLYTQ